MRFSSSTRAYSAQATPADIMHWRSRESALFSEPRVSTRENPILRAVPVLLLMSGLLLLSGCISRPVPVTIPPLESSPTVSAQQDNSPVVRWTLREVQRNARRVAPSDYVVKLGDTLYAIGQHVGVGTEAMARANDLSPPFVLYPGQRLRVPAGLYHRISSGETGIAIARAYGVRWSQIVSLNQLTAPFTLRIGQGLRLPDGTPPLPIASQIARHAAEFTLDIDDLITGNQPAQVTKTVADKPRQVGVPPAASENFTGRFQWPLAGEVIADFGPLAQGKINDGINIAARPSAEVSAAGDGVVVYAGKEISVYGGLILINHGNGWISAYGHAAALNVTRGQRVKVGETIALAGESGQVQSPQLHFQIRKDRIPVNPIQYLPLR